MPSQIGKLHSLKTKCKMNTAQFIPDGHQHEGVNGFTGHFVKVTITIKPQRSGDSGRCHDRTASDEDPRLAARDAMTDEEPIETV